MKKFIALSMLTLSVTTFAGNFKEFDEATEIKCYQQLKTLGCVKNDEENQTCSEKNKLKLSKDCQQIHAARKSNK